MGVLARFFGLQRPIDKITPFLIQVFNALGTNYDRYAKHLSNGVARNVRSEKNAGRLRFLFSYGPGIAAYHDERISSFTVNGIRVFDTLSKGYVSVEIWLSHGRLICCDVLGVARVDVDVERIDLSNVTYEHLDTSEEIADRLSPSDLALLDVSEVYEVVINGTTILHLFDVADGDFVGIDGHNVPVLVTHDPEKIVFLNETITEAIMSRKSSL